MECGPKALFRKIMNAFYVIMWHYAYGHVVILASAAKKINCNQTGGLNDLTDQKGGDFSLFLQHFSLISEFQPGKTTLIF